MLRRSACTYDRAVYTWLRPTSMNALRSRGAACTLWHKGPTTSDARTSCANPTRPR